MDSNLGYLLNLKSKTYVLKKNQLEELELEKHYIYIQGLVNLSSYDYDRTAF